MVLQRDGIGARVHSHGEPGIVRAGAPLRFPRVSHVDVHRGLGPLDRELKRVLRPVRNVFSAAGAT